MRCPQCQRENQFPVPGLCPDCYRQWKEKMRARYGPGPWPHQPTCFPSSGLVSEEIDAAVLQEERPLAENDAIGAVKRRVQAVLTQLETTEQDNLEFLEQLDWVLRKVVQMVVCSVAEPDSHCAQSDDRTYYPRSTNL
ncbi:MAG: hypothetical protein ACOX4G_04185 [Limnochordia bacterium]|jgi:hypothetical protein